MKPLRAEAFAKVNLSLRVRSVDSSGYHPLVSLVQSIGWKDEIELAPADEDRLTITGASLPGDERNLAWSALVEVRRIAAAARPVALRLAKSIPAAAGLGGGSADAAAALVAAGRLFGVDRAALERLAPALGADVPFCLRGGTAVMTGYGERIAPLDLPLDYVLVVVMPPLELATADVYGTWDRLGEPGGPSVAGPHLPPSLREYAPLVNDLYAAAVAVAPALDDWRSELRARWDRPVLMSGSGSALFAFFGSHDEADDAWAVIPPGARAAEVVAPVARGWSLGES